MAKVGDKDIEDKVFETTREMLLKYGVKGWNMDDLSEECGMSKRTLYKIIANKEELLLKTSINQQESNIAKIERYFKSSESYEFLLNNFEDTLIDIYDEFIIKNAEILSKEYPRIGEAINKRKQGFKQIYTDFFRKAEELGFFVEFFKPAAMYGIINDILTYYILNCKSKIEFEEKMRFAIKALIRGIRK